MNNNFSIFLSPISFLSPPQFFSLLPDFLSRILLIRPPLSLSFPLLPLSLSSPIFSLGGGEEDGRTSTCRHEKKEGGGRSAAMRMAEVAEVLLRVAPMGLSVGAMAMMLKNSEDNDYGYISYSNLTAFTYLVYANGICAVYSLFFLIFTSMGP